LLIPAPEPGPIDFVYFPNPTEAQAIQFSTTVIIGGSPLPYPSKAMNWTTPYGRAGRALLDGGASPVAFSTAPRRGRPAEAYHPARFPALYTVKVENTLSCLSAYDFMRGPSALFRIAMTCLELNTSISSASAQPGCVKRSGQL
jgi:hypothetical protein